MNVVRGAALVRRKQPNVKQQSANFGRWVLRGLLMKASKLSISALAHVDAC